LRVLRLSYWGRITVDDTRRKKNTDTAVTTRLYRGTCISESSFSPAASESVLSSDSHQSCVLACSPGSPEDGFQHDTGHQTAVPNRLSLGTGCSNKLVQDAASIQTILCKTARLPFIASHRPTGTRRAKKEEREETVESRPVYGIERRRPKGEDAMNARRHRL